MKRKLIIHPGFHKTGTTSAQEFLKLNNDLLSPFVTCYQHGSDPTITRLLQAARGFGRYEDVYSRLKFQTRIVDLFEFVAEAPTSNVLITSEGLSGHILGYKGRTSFDATFELVSDITQRFDLLLGEDWDLELIYTTRERGAWLKSVYNHLIETTNFDEDWEPFRDRLWDQAGLEGVVSKIRQIAGKGRVYSFPLEALATHPLGPGLAMIERLNLPDDMRAKLKPSPHSNPSLLGERLAKIRRINRLDLSSQERLREISKLE